MAPSHRQDVQLIHPFLCELFLNEHFISAFCAFCAQTDRGKHACYNMQNITTGQTHHSLRPCVAGRHAMGCRSQCNCVNTNRMLAVHSCRQRKAQLSAPPVSRRNQLAAYHHRRLRYHRACRSKAHSTHPPFEIQVPGVRYPQWVHHRSLPLDVPALPPSTVVSPLCPGRSPASPRPSPPSSLRFAFSWLVEFGSFALLRPGESFKFCPLLEKMEECTISKKEASSCHTSNTKLKEFDMTRMTNF